MLPLYQNKDDIMKLKFHHRLLLLTCKLMAMLPYRLIYGLGWLCGTLSYYLNIKANRTIRTNITRCFPILTHSQQEKLIRHAMQHAAIRVLEMIFFWFAPIIRILKVVRCVSGEQESILKDSQKGISHVGMHLHHGGWELLNCYLGSRYHFSALYKPPSNAFQRIVLQQVRERLGKTKMHPVSIKGIKCLIHDLHMGRPIAISPDHVPADGKGIWSTFFDIPTLTITLPHKIVKKYQKKAFIYFTIRLPKGRGFSIHIEPVDPAFYDDNVTVATAALNQPIETIVRKNPEQYEWTYKRFRKRPPNGDNTEEFYNI